MSITVDSRFRDALVPEATITIRVTADGAPARLADALRAAGADIPARYVSRPVPVPGGQVMIVDLGTSPGERIREIPDRIAARLHEAGITDATIGRAEEIGDRYRVVQALRPAARAILRGPLGTPLGQAPGGPPYRLRDIAAGWLDRARRSGVELTSVTRGAEVPVAWADLTGITSAVLDVGGSVALLATDFAGEVVAASVAGGLGGLTPQASLTAAGTGWTWAQVAQAMRGQREIVRANAADLVWAGVSAEPDARDVLAPYWAGRGPGATRPPVEPVADLLVPDVAWYTVLSTGHLDRLGGPPDGAVALPGGRVEVTIGEPEQWVSGHPDAPAVRAAAEAVLGPCLAAPDVAFELSRQRIARLRAGGLRTTH